MLRSREVYPIKLTLSAQEKDTLDTIIDRIEAELGVRVSMAWVFRTFLALCQGDADAEFEAYRTGKPIKLTVAEQALLNQVTRTSTVSTTAVE
jgi:hypothetical protein